MRNVLLIFVCTIMPMCVEASLAKITIQLQDADTGLVPTNVTNGKVRFEFKNKNGFLGNRDTYSEKRPDENGKVTVWGLTELGDIGFQYCNIEYWGNWGGYKFTNSLIGTWWPMNPTVVFKVHRKEKGMRLFVNLMEAPEDDFMRKHGGKVAYDLLLADWLPPIGTGEVADVIHELLPRHKVSGDSYRQELVFYFPGDGNGVCPVQEFLPHSFKIREAPVGGYSNIYTNWTESMSGGALRPSLCEQNLCFRIRSKKDNDGNVLSAYYGKVYGGMEIKRLNWNEECMISGPYVLYYINPTPNERFLQHEGRSLCPTYKREVLHP